tara:strand:- start:5308 stop:6060 length:753 start_codon:yes stop_codon:yes gene_type:complete
MRYFKYFLFSFGLLAMTACSDDSDDNNQEPGTTLPGPISGTSVNLQCSFASNGAPHQEGEEALFSFGSTGSLAIDFNPAANDGNEVSVSSSTLVGNEYIWEDASGGYKYALSLSTDDSLNEVNVFDLQDNFLNQWTPIPDGPANLNLIKALAGTYTVSSVNGGTHTRGTFSISADGSIDFDDGIAFSPSDYALVTDRLSVLDAIFVDMQPWPDEPYPRIKLFVDPNDQSQLVQVVYRANYPNTGSIEINF